MVKNKINLRTQTRIGAVFVFVVLVIVAYFVSLKISGSGSVSPNAPESQPKAFMPCVNVRCIDGYTCNKATNKCVKNSTVKNKTTDACEKKSDCLSSQECVNGKCVSNNNPTPTEKLPRTCNENNCPPNFYCDDETLRCVPEPTSTPTPTVEVPRETTPTPTKVIGDKIIKCPSYMKSNGKCEKGNVPLSVANCCVSTFYHY